MSNALSKEQRSAALSIGTELRLPWNESIGQEFGVDQTKWRALTETKFAAAQSSATVVLALAYCKVRNIDPMKGLIHIVPVWDKNLRKMVDTIWPGIGELRTTAFRTRQYAGKAETVYGRDMTETLGGVTVTFPEWAQITLKRLVNGTPIEFAGPRVYWIEAYATAGKDSDAPNDMWKNRPRGQIEKCAEAAALRAAFPEEVGNDYCADEIRPYERGAVVIDAPQVEKPKTLADLVKPAITHKPANEHATHIFTQCMTALDRAKKQEHLDWVGKQMTPEIVKLLTDDQCDTFHKRWTEVAEQLNGPLTPKQSYEQCLLDVATMSLEEAQAHIKNNVNTDGWDMQWSLDMDKVLEGKAK